MKFFAILTAAAAMIAGLGASNAMAAEVHINVAGVQARGGLVLIQVQDKFQYKGALAAGQAIGNGYAEGLQTFSVDLPPGEYAASVLHDANGNFGLDTDDNDKPLEGVSSSETTPVNRRPTFDEARFTVGSDGAVVNMVMRYPN